MPRHRERAGREKKKKKKKKKKKENIVPDGVYQGALP